MLLALYRIWFLLHTDADCEKEFTSPQRRGEQMSPTERLAGQAVGIFGSQPDLRPTRACLLRLIRLGRFRGPQK
jgi:hypothetical protein